MQGSPSEIEVLVTQAWLIALTKSFARRRCCNNAFAAVASVFVEPA